MHRLLNIFTRIFSFLSANANEAVMHGDAVQMLRSLETLRGIKD